MYEETCRTCKYFLQHYGLREGKLFAICCGHCTFSRFKRKCPDNTACEHFAAGTPDTDEFADKSYLSKQLLEYILKMELLPEIEDLQNVFKKAP